MSSSDPSTRSVPAAAADSATPACDAGPAAVEAPLPLVAYRLTGGGAAPIVPARAQRDWMRGMVGQFAHRCLPLLMANQSGWFLLNPAPLRAEWDGGEGRGAVTIEFLDGAPEYPVAASIFGYGILTWRVDYLFRTPPGYDLLVSGPPNMPRDGIQALQGLVETDWAVASFTMNWKFTRAHHPVVFQAGDAFCMVVPQRRWELERFEPTIRPLAENPVLEAEWREFERRRRMMVGMRDVLAARSGPAAAAQVPWERHYFQGTTPLGSAAPEHRTRRSLREFAPEPEAGPGTGQQPEPGAQPPRERS